MKRRLVDTLHHAAYPAEVLVEELDQQGLIHWESARHPLFDTLFVMQDSADSKDEAGGVSWQPLRHNVRAAKLDLAVQVEACGEQYVLTFEYRSALFLESSIQRLAACMDQVLVGAVETPDSVVGVLTSKAEGLVFSAATAASGSVLDRRDNTSSGPDLFEDAFDF
jgi:surfactin family lipopeptide synthetase A